MQNPYRSSRNRGRRREARQWLDFIAAVTTNTARDPVPIRVEEGYRMYIRALDDLESVDPDLWRAAQEISWDESDARLKLSLPEWQVEACRNARRWIAVREALRRAESTRIGQFTYTERRGRRELSLRPKF